MNNQNFIIEITVFNTPLYVGDMSKDESVTLGNPFTTDAKAAMIFDDAKYVEAENLDNVIKRRLDVYKVTALLFRARLMGKTMSMEEIKSINTTDVLKAIFI